jgi:hypothetical protein
MRKVLDFLPVWDDETILNLGRIFKNSAYNYCLQEFQPVFKYPMQV